jgi:hypothetical protein
MGIAPVERRAVEVAERVVVRRRADVVAELDEFRDGRAVEDVAAPIAYIGEMDPVGRTEIRRVIVQDRGVGGLGGGGKIGILSDTPFAKKMLNWSDSPCS